MIPGVHQDLKATPARQDLHSRVVQVVFLLLFVPLEFQSPTVDLFC